MKIADFFATIGFDVDDNALDQVEKKIEGVREQTLKMTAVLGAAVFAMDRFTASSIKSVVALTNFNVQTGLATDKLQKWQAAAQLSNMAVDAEQVVMSVQALQQSLTQIRLGTGNAAPFQLLGIDIQGQDAFSVLEQVRNRIQGLSPAMASNMIQQMGIDPNLLNVLRLSREEFDELGNSLVRSKRTTEAIMRIGNAINSLKLRAAKFKDEVVARLEPVFMTMIDILERFGRGVERILSLFERFPAVGALAAAGLTALLVPLKVLRGLLSPITLAFGALFLILEDIAVYFQGGKSITGIAIEKLKTLAERMKDMFQPFLDFLRNISSTINDSIIVPIENAVTKLKELAPNTQIPPAEKGSVRDKFERFILGMGADEASIFGGIMRAMPFGQTAQQYQNQLNTLNNAPVINNSFTISGQTSNDIARDIVREMQNQLNYGLTDLNNGAVY